jgi:hypothetical protein
MSTPSSPSAPADTAPNVQQAELAAAVRQVVGAMTDFHGADCLLFAAIGAGAMQQLGCNARPVAGSTAWRVGPGDVDTISHAREISGALYTTGVALQTLQFHSWVEAPGLLVDFSTANLRTKASMLDAADGGKTQVDWAPDYLWLEGPPGPAMLATPVDVNQSYDVGVYCYVRHADIEAIVLPDIERMMRDLSPAINAAVTSYHALCAGHQIKVVGIGDNASLQTAPQLRELTRYR